MLTVSILLLVSAFIILVYGRLRNPPADYTWLSLLLVILDLLLQVIPLGKGQ
jgi:hypothetical protein